MARIALRARTTLRASDLLQVGESRSIPPHPIMPRPPRHVAPTLVDAVRALEGDAERGFVFVRADGTERLRSFQEMAVEAGRRAASLAALGLEKGERVALVIPDGEEFVLSLLGTLFAGLVPVPLSPQLSMSSIEGYHATVAHIARAAGAVAPAHDDGGAAVRRGRSGAGRRAARHRHRRRALGIEREPGDACASRLARRPRAHPVHEREHLAPEGRDGHPRQPRRERRGLHDPRPGSRSRASTRA